MRPYYMCKCGGLSMLDQLGAREDLQPFFGRPKSRLQELLDVTGWKMEVVLAFGGDLA